jgi:Outer membrane protein beta-barrel domain
VKNLLFILVVVALLVPANVCAQEKTSAFGLKGGINMANLVFDGIDYETDEESLMRLAGGLTFGSTGKPGIGFDVDFLYVQCGAKQVDESGGELDGTYEVETQLDYIECAPMLHMSFGEGGAGPYLLGGGFVSYLLSAENVVTRNGEEASPVDVKDSLKDINYGVTFGAGLQLGAAGQGGFFVEARYVLGLANIYDDEGEEDKTGETEIEIKTTGIYAFAGIRF